MILERLPAVGQVGACGYVPRWWARYRVQCDACRDVYVIRAWPAQARKHTICHPCAQRGAWRWRGHRKPAVAA